MDWTFRKNVFNNSCCCDGSSSGGTGGTGGSGGVGSATFGVRNRYTVESTNTNVNGDTSYLYLTRCNGVLNSGGSFTSGEVASLAAYISATTVAAPTGTTWTCHQDGVFTVDCSIVWDQQNTLALYGLMIEFNGVGTDLRYTNTRIHNLTEEFSMNISCILPMVAGDRFQVKLLANQPLNLLWQEPGTNRSTQVNIMRIG